MRNAEIERWVQWAKSDLDSASILSKHTVSYSQTIFFCHEAVEKYLKALIQEQGKKFPYVHSLYELVSHVTLEKDDSILISNAINVLEALYPVARYPSKQKIEKSDVVESLKRTIQAQKILMKYFG